MSVLGVLAVIALASTDLALFLQTYLGQRTELLLLGPVVAATAAALFALWLSKHE
ncbi:hypothetical protein AB7M37_004812 [Sinorhizobium fredii]